MSQYISYQNHPLIVEFECCPRKICAQSYREFYEIYAYLKIYGQSMVFVP